MTTRVFDIVHRRIILRRTNRRCHWREAHHGADHDRRIAVQWAQRWIIRSRSIITEDLTVETPRPGDYAWPHESERDFLMNLRPDSPIVVHFRTIVGGQSANLPIYFPVPPGVSALMLDVPT